MVVFPARQAQRQTIVEIADNPDRLRSTTMHYVGMHVIDTLDQRLIALLRADGRASMSKMAGSLNVSRGTAQNRLDRLIEDGAILGFTVRVRQDIDDHMVRAIMTIQLAGKTTTAIVARLRGVPEIRALHTTNGTWDLIAEIGVDTLPGLDRVLGTIRAVDGIRSSETSILLSSM
jgi:DNA-binding Lrp family transcriptional regulator